MVVLVVFMLCVLEGKHIGKKRKKYGKEFSSQTFKDLSGE